MSKDGRRALSVSFVCSVVMHVDNSICCLEFGFGNESNGVQFRVTPIHGASLRIECGHDELLPIHDWLINDEVFGL